jgi:RanBP1 domain
LKPVPASNKAWTWFAMDFSQGELLLGQFAVRFKTDEQAMAFKNKFVKCQATLDRPAATINAPAVEEVKASEPASVLETEESA